MRPQLRVFTDADALARGAADELLRRTRAKADGGTDFSLALSGGATPLRLYRLLAEEPFRGQLPWDRIHFFWGDERPVPPAHADSNYGAAQQALFSKLALPAGQIHRVPAEMADPSEAAGLYERELRDFFALSPWELPRFDLVLLGLGADGHTASLFPGSEALSERRRLVAAPWIDTLGTYRITLTCPVLNNAACILFLVSGAEKAETLHAVIEGHARAAAYPARRIRALRGELLWFVDRAAAGPLRGVNRHQEE